VLPAKRAGVTDERCCAETREQALAHVDWMMVTDLLSPRLSTYIQGCMNAVTRTHFPRNLGIRFL
jgi:hypothetical protein